MIAKSRYRPSDDQEPLPWREAEMNEHVKRETAKIRSGWSEAKRDARCVGPSAVSWSVPFVDSRELGLEEDR